MTRYSKKPPVSEQTRDEAMKIARGTQKPGQTKEQTKLIAQGIQKGIDLYKKKQKSKARELDKKLKQVTKGNDSEEDNAAEEYDHIQNHHARRLPWVLLILSWIAFAICWVYAPNL
jgi:hypothetical protein